MLVLLHTDRLQLLAGGDVSADDIAQNVRYGIRQSSLAIALVVLSVAFTSV